MTTHIFRWIHSFMPHGFNPFKLNPNSIHNFGSRGCEKAQTMLQNHNMLAGYSKNYDVLFPGATLPQHSLLSQPIYRGYPLANLFNNREAVDGGLYSITFFLGQESKKMLENAGKFGAFVMADLLDFLGKDIVTSHIIGWTLFRSYTESIAVAVAFSATKAQINAALVWEHSDLSGSNLLAIPRISNSVVPSGHPDDAETFNTAYSVANGNEYQKELCGILVPYSRIKGITITPKTDHILRLTEGYNINNPLYMRILEILAANTDPALVERIHRYDHDSVNNASQLGICYYDLRQGQNLDVNQRTSLQKKFYKAYQESLEIEKTFRSDIHRMIKEQQEKGNQAMINLKLSSFVDPEKGNYWFFSALCASLGEYRSHNN